jgi:hypothetical protein
VRLGDGPHLQFDNPHLGPFDVFENDQVDFTQEFNDLGLGWVSERIMAVAVAGVPVGPPDDGGRSWRFLLRPCGPSGDPAKRFDVIRLP